jgi:hypothetical protein
MTIRASRGVRLLTAAAMAWLGLALCAQAAHATYGKVTIAKVNQGGNPSDTFGFGFVLGPAPGPGNGSFSVTGAPNAASVGASNEKTYEVQCNAGSGCPTPQAFSVTEQAKPGYSLKSIACVHAQGTTGFPGEPSPNSPADGDTTVSGAAISLKVNIHEWVKCYVTNAPAAPAINVVKTGPGTAAPGDTLTFGYTVTNPGNVPLTGVTATDDKCSPLTRTGNTSDTTLDPGDTWTYTCSYVLQWSQGNANPVVNTVTTCGMPPGGGTPGGPAPVCATAQHATTVAVSTTAASSTPPQSAVSPARVRPGSAKLRGPSGCPTTTAVAATVTGRRIVRVTFYVDNKKVKTLTRPNRKGGQWVLPMNVRRFAFGTHRVRARIVFARSSQTPARTLRLSFNRCRPASVTPKFTG